MTGPEPTGLVASLCRRGRATATDYAFLLDDDPTPYPDPRSLWQPNGVHGPSRLYDHTHSQWTDAGWQAPPLASAIVYELHVGTFTPEGTFDAAIEPPATTSSTSASPTSS